MSLFNKIFDNLKARYDKNLKEYNELYLAGWYDLSEQDKARYVHLSSLHRKTDKKINLLMCDKKNP